jgi:hypothetical protein
MNKTGDYDLVQKFKGYHAREDPTMLTPDILVSPSQNVVIKTSGRVATVKGYVLDGAASTTADSGILSNFDFTNFKGDVRNVRAGFLTTAANDGKLQYRFKSATNVVSWVDLKTALTNVRLSFCEYWDNTALVKLMLWVDGSNNVFAWNGAVTTLASATVNTITKQGTNTWAQEGFSAAGGTLVLGGVVASYTGGTATTKLTGVSVDFSNSTTYPVASTVHQEVVTSALSGMTSILATFAPTIIGCGRRNQVYLGTSNSNVLYISVVNNYKSYAFTSPTRVVGEGALIPLDAPPTGFLAQESQISTDAYDMYISERTSTWAVIRATLSSDLTKETLEHIRLKLSEKQGAKSNRLMGKMKNHIMYVGYDNVACLLGYLSYKFVPTIVDFSYPIIDDMNSYDFTDASIFYYRNYIYIAIPRHGVVRIYNMTDQTSEQFSGAKSLEDVTQQPWFFEAPISYPISGFYVVDGDLYGHSYTTSESYKLFTGGSFNGQTIRANATFAYDDKGDRTQSKGSTELWVEGYIAQNTQLTCTISGDLDSFKTSQTVTIFGNDNSIVAYGGGGNSLGDSPLGVQTLGGNQNTVSTTAIPAWFHVVKTYPQVPFYLEQISFETNGYDLEWQLITHGTNSSFTTEGNNSISQ